MANRSPTVKATGSVEKRANAPSGKPAEAAPDTGGSGPSPAPDITYGDMPSYLGYDLRRASLLMNTMANRALAAVDLRTTWVSVLEVISRNAGLKQSRIADLLDIKKANLVAIINALEQRGAVRRLPSPLDRRAYSLHLTASGRMLLKQAKKIGQENEKTVIARLGKENHGLLIQMLCMVREEFSKPSPLPDDDEE